MNDKQTAYNYIDENADAQAALLYPNPTTGMIYIESQGLQEVSVYNLMGQELLRQSAINGQASIDMTTFPEGSYFVKLTGMRNEIKKVVKLQ